MKATKRFKPVVALAGVLLLASCTSYNAYRRGQQLAQTQQYDSAVIEFERALSVDPENTVYKLAYDNARIEASRQHFEKGKMLLAAGQLEAASTELELAARLDETNQYAMVELVKVQQKLVEMRAQQSQTFDQIKKQAKESSKAQPPRLNPASTEPISLSFPTETSIKDIYKALGNAFGINVLFDQGVKDDRIAIELRDVTAQTALERLMQAGNHFYKVLDEQSIIVIPDNPQTRRDYEDLVIQTFYLSNGDAEQVTNVVRTMIEARNVFPLKALNAITIRDTADKVRIAEKIIESNDKAKSEVVIQVELLQVDASKMRDIGAVASLQGKVLPVNDAGELLVQADLDTIKSLGSDNLSFTLPTASYSLVKQKTDGKLLARPQLRISEGEKATLHIGQKQPIPVSTLYTSTVPGQNQGPITSFQYQDIGIKISIEPRVHHNREITLKLTVEVSNITGYVRDTSGTTPAQPIIGTRTIESTIRLQDGETNFLAGLYRQDDASTKDITPFLGDLPLLGRLFTREKVDFMTTDLVLTMTPHIIRVPDVTADDLVPMWVGTQNNLSFRGMSPRLESRTEGDPFTSFPRQQPAPPQTPQEGDGNTPQEPSNVMRGGGPSDAFSKPATPAERPFRGVPPQPTTPQPDEERSQVTTGESPVAAVAAPRIGLEPATLPLGFGTFQVWRVVGLDLDGLATESVELLYDNATLDVTDVALGSALAIDPVVPPSISIDREAGRIRVASTDTTRPLLFNAGGEILVMKVRGLAPGTGFAMLDGLVLRGADGRRTPVSLSGGRADVQ